MDTKPCCVIKCVTPASAVKTDKPVLRTVYDCAANINSFEQIKVLFYKQPHNSVIVKDVSEICLMPESADVAEKIDSLLMSGTWCSE